MLIINIITLYKFELTAEEFEGLRSQFATSNKRDGTPYMPFAFTEQEVAIEVEKFALICHISRFISFYREKSLP